MGDTVWERSFFLPTLNNQFLGKLLGSKSTVVTMLVSPLPAFLCASVVCVPFPLTTDVLLPLGAFKSIDFTEGKSEHEEGERGGVEVSKGKEDSCFLMMHLGNSKETV